MSMHLISKSYVTFLSYDFEHDARENKLLFVEYQSGQRVLKVLDWSNLSFSEKWDHWARGSYTLGEVANCINDLLKEPYIRDMSLDQEQMALQCAYLKKKLNKHQRESLFIDCDVNFTNHYKKNLFVEIFYPRVSRSKPEHHIQAKAILRIPYSRLTTFDKIHKHINRKLTQLGSAYFLRESIKSEYVSIKDFSRCHMNVWETAVRGKNKYTIVFEGIHLPRFAAYHAKKSRSEGYAAGFDRGHSRRLP